MKYKPILTKHGYYYTDPNPTQEEIKKYYEEEFYQKPKTSINDSSLEVRERDNEFYGFWYNFYLDLVPSLLTSSNNSLVDLGCGYGHFLSFIKNNSNISDLTGVEPFPEFLDYVESNGMSGYISTLESFTESPPQKYDIVTMINVLEHINDPEKVLKNIHKNLIHKNGSLILQVPNDFNVIQKIAVEKNSCKEWWFAPPQHISYYSPQSLENLLSECGFKAITTFCSFPIDMFLLMGKDYINDPLNHNQVSVQLSLDIISSGIYALENSQDITVPMLVVHGRNDELTSYSASKKLVENSGPNIKFIGFNDAYHEIHNEPEKEELLRNIFNWINSI